MNSHKVLNLKDILKILESGEFKNLENVRESQEFEFKSKKPYVFDEKRNIPATAELAKDASSIGNADGGIIVFGISRREENGHDIVDKFELFKKDEFYTERDIVGRIKLTIYPTLEELLLKWYPSKEDQSLGLGALLIPKQRDARKYFVVNIVIVDGETLKGVYFGIPVRKDDKIDWFEIKDMKFLRQMFPSSTDEQYMGIMQGITDIKGMMRAKNNLPDKKSSLKKRMEEDNG